MSYLKIANVGEMQKEALMLLGGTTKTGDDSKIGMFGSGNKYALAFLLREKYDFRIFSGTNEIKISTVKKRFRDKEFDVITIDGQETSITTESGPEWELWYAMREIYSNALDEGFIEMNESMDVFPVAGETHFYIQWTGEIKEFYENLHLYFCRKRQPINTNFSFGKILSCVNENQLIVYRKGIRVHISDTPCLFNYDFRSISINESRVVVDLGKMIGFIQRVILNCDVDSVVDQFYACSANDKFIEQQSVPSWHRPEIKVISESYLTRMPKKYLATYSHLLLLSEQEQKDVHLVQPWFYDLMVNRFGDKISHPAFRNASFKTDSPYREIEIDAKISSYLKVVKEFFVEVGYEFSREIKIVDFGESKKVCRVSGSTILLSRKAFDRGRSTLIKNIIYMDHVIQAKEREVDVEQSLVEALTNYMADKNSYLF